MKIFTMKVQFLISFLLSVVLITGCNQKAADKTQTQESTETASQEGNEVETEVEIPSQVPYVMASIRRTPCYGQCPVFEAKFMTDGSATYHGKMFVDKIGHYAAQVDEALLESIRTKSFEVNFFDFYNKYPVEDVQIADLPTTVTYLRIGDQEKTVIHKFQAPDELKAYENFLVDLIDNIKWKKIEVKD